MRTRNLLQLILDLRSDLRDGQGFNLSTERRLYFSWLITNGIREYPSLLEDNAFLHELATTSIEGVLSELQRVVLLSRPDVQAAFPLPDNLSEFRDWFYTHGVEECGIWPFLSDTERKLVQELPEPWASRLAGVQTDHKPTVTTCPASEHPFGVNIIGYAFGQLGIGEDARMAARALQAGGLQMTMLNFPPGPDIPQNDLSMAEYVSKNGNFAINMFCMTAEETGRFYAQRGSTQFQRRYNIGYWPWELGKWPEKWKMLIDLVDEIWVSTQHTYDAIRPISSKPTLIMPMAVQLGPISQFSQKDTARQHFGLPQTAKLFCFAFDLNSYIDRKNPQACVDAFLRAFPQDEFDADAVGLVIKVHKPKQNNQHWERITELASTDTRIHIIEGTLARPDLLALYQACDCFLSLHRAEGFGRGIAEAMQLGLHVICTGYSGNVDFCRTPSVNLVRYRLVEVRKDQYPNAENQVWADPDLVHAAELMLNFFRQPNTSPHELYWPEFSVEFVGKLYRKRLEAIWESMPN